MWRGALVVAIVMAAVGAAGADTIQFSLGLPDIDAQMGPGISYGSGNFVADSYSMFLTLPGGAVADDAALPQDNFHLTAAIDSAGHATAGTLDVVFNGFLENAPFSAESQEFHSTSLAAFRYDFSTATFAFLFNQGAGQPQIGVNIRGENLTGSSFAGGFTGDISNADTAPAVPLPAPVATIGAIMGMVAVGRVWVRRGTDLGAVAA